MKKLTAVLIAAALVLSCAAVSGADGMGWQEAYRELLREAFEKWEPLRNDAAVEKSYLLYDMDKDGTPELVLKTGTCEADYAAAIYTFRDGGAALVGETGAGHCTFYGDTAEKGLIIYNAHMGYAYAMRFWIRDNGLDSEQLFEDNLYPRLEQDPDAWYQPITDFIPGAVPLTLADAGSLFPLTHYEEICTYLAGNFPRAEEETCPGGDSAFYTKLITGFTPVVAVPVDQFSNRPGLIGFQELLKKDVAAQWMDGDLSVTALQEADLNGDGKLECILELVEPGGRPMRFFLSEQNGTVYAYLQNYAYNTASVDENGNLLVRSVYDYDTATYHYRLLFDGEECMLLELA